MEDELGRYSKVAALSVFFASEIFVLAVLILIIVMGMLQSSPMNTDFVQSLIASCSKNVNHCNVEMELIIQETRGSHAGLALYYRFTISATAIVVALSMVVLGSVLIFDRITSASHPMPAEPGDRTRDDNWFAGSLKDTFSAGSPFPGLLMVGMGSFFLMATLLLAGPKAPHIYVPVNGQVAQGASMSLGRSSLAASDNPQQGKIRTLDHAAEQPSSNSAGPVFDHVGEYASGAVFH